jgi:hypothetical protein
MSSSSHRAATQAFYVIVLESSSDEVSDGKTDILMAAIGTTNEEFMLPPCKGGSSKKQETNIDRDQETGQMRLYKDYFYPINLLYKEKAFLYRYRISRTVSGHSHWRERL